ncbi:MAG: histidine--tRNA ligase [Actinomycetes bacterium]
MTAAPSEPFRALTGMRDVLPPEAGRRRALLAQFAAAAGRAGYAEVAVPVLEELGVFERLGEATDVVSKEMYHFTDQDGTELALRPELTAGVVRAFVQHAPTLPWKVWVAGTAFRRERPQRGRYRMFDQVGVEVLGVDDPDLDVEVVALAWQVLADVGLRDVTLLVNSLGDHEDRARYTEAVRSYFEEVRGRLSEGEQDTLDRNPLRLLDAKRPELAPVIARAPELSAYRSDESASHYERVLTGLRAVGVPYTEAPRLVRGLDYYRRTTFELTSGAIDAAQNALGGGGRYDRLAEELGGRPTDGIGFALGVDRVLLALEAEGVEGDTDPGLDAFVVDLTGGEAARDLTHELRAAGLAADRRFGGGSMRSQMKHADRSGAAVALIVGEDELQSGEVTLRPLRGHGADGVEQHRVRRKALVAELRALQAPAPRPGDGEH